MRLNALVNHGDTTTFRYNSDGTLSTPNPYPGGTPPTFIGDPLAYFNNGELAENAGYFSTTTFDSKQRLLSMKIPGTSSSTPEKMRYYYYDSTGALLKTKTNNAGMPTDYWSELTWQNGDVTNLKLTGAGGMSSQFRYAYYETECQDQYFSMLDCIQIGFIRNRHLLKSSAYQNWSDSVLYSYALDPQGKVMSIYANKEVGGWITHREVDTTFCVYKCQ